MNIACKPAVTVRDVSAGYGDVIVMRDISFTVRRGEVFGILGGSGSGKSTLLKAMIGLVKPASGEIEIEGESIVTARGSDRLRLLRRFGVAYQGGALFGSMTVLENVRVPLDEFTLLPNAAKDAIALAKLGLVGLETAALKMPSELSGGMLKRAALARAMALDPGIVFLDEPSAGLDPVTAADLDELIRGLTQNLGITFVIVTHELASIFSVIERVVVLDGRARTIVAEGNPWELKAGSSNPWVRQLLKREASSRAAQTSEGGI